MRQYFYKSGLLFSIFIMVAIIFSLCGSAIENNQKLSKFLPVLSDDYVILEASGKKALTLEDYRKSFESIKGKYIFGVVLSGGYMRAVGDSENALSDFTLKSGKMFSNEDYKQHTNTVMIREDMELLCENKEGNMYYYYDGASYKVIGVYEDRNRESQTSAKCIFNIYASSLSDNTEWEVGFFDAGERSSALLDESMIIHKLALNYYAAKSEQNNYFASFGNNLGMMLLIYLGLAFMVLLNSFTAIQNWLEGKKHEIAVRRLVGASKGKVHLWLISNFMSFVIISMMIGMMFVKVFLLCINLWDISPTMVLMFGEKISLIGSGYSFIILLLIGLVLICISLKIQLQQELVSMLHKE